MTCIVAHADGWMVADRRVNSNETMRNPYDAVKITKRPGLLIATSGPAVLRDLVRESVGQLRGAEAFNAAVSVVRAQQGEQHQRGHALAVTEYGVFEICSRGSVSRLAWPFWASGSGYMAALGYLRGFQDGYAVAVESETNWATPPSIKPADAVRAIEFASELDCMVGDGTQIEYLKGEP